MSEWDLLALGFLKIRGCKNVSRCGDLSLVLLSRCEGPVTQRPLTS